MIPIPKVKDLAKVGDVSIAITKSVYVDCLGFYKTYSTMSGMSRFQNDYPDEFTAFAREHPGCLLHDFRLWLFELVLGV